MTDFQSNLQFIKKILDRFFKIAKQNQKEKHVLRYIGKIDLEPNKFEVKLVSESIDSNIGQLKAGEHLIEFYILNNGTLVFNSTVLFRN